MVSFSDRYLPILLFVILCIATWMLRPLLIIHSRHMKQRALSRAAHTVTLSSVYPLPLIAVNAAHCIALAEQASILDDDYLLGVESMETGDFGCGYREHDTSLMIARVRSFPDAFSFDNNQRHFAETRI